MEREISSKTAIIFVRKHSYAPIVAQDPVASNLAAQGDIYLPFHRDDQQSQDGGENGHRRGKRQGST